jgi:hypothetical protein
MCVCVLFFFFFLASLDQQKATKYVSVFSLIQPDSRNGAHEILEECGSVEAFMHYNVKAPWKASSWQPVMTERDHAHRCVQVLDRSWSACGNSALQCIAMPFRAIPFSPNGRSNAIASTYREGSRKRCTSAIKETSSTLGQQSTRGSEVMQQ